MSCLHWEQGVADLVTSLPVDRVDLSDRRLASRIVNMLLKDMRVFPL